MRHDNVASTLIRRHFEVVCLLGIVQTANLTYLKNDLSCIFWCTIRIKTQNSKSYKFALLPSVTISWTLIFFYFVADVKLNQLRFDLEYLIRDELKSFVPMGGASSRRRRDKREILMEEPFNLNLIKTSCAFCLKRMLITFYRPNGFENNIMLLTGNTK